MLALHQYTRVLAGRACKSVLIIACSFTSLYSFEYQDGLEAAPRPCEQEWVLRYFNSLSDEISIEEVVDFLISFKAALQAKGHQVPPLSDLCLKIKDYLIENKIEIDDDDINEIYNEILSKHPSKNIVEAKIRHLKERTNR